MKKYNFTYQTKNLINGKTYIGVHRTDNLNDGYIGCGLTRSKKTKNKTPFQKAVNKYGYDNFKCEILYFFDTYQEALDEEVWLVNEKWVEDKNNYNVRTGGEQFIFTEAHFNKISKNIFQFDLYGNLIKEWESTTQIYNNLGFSRDCITECCRGSKGFYNKFQWSYNNDCDMYYNERSYRTIHQYDLQGNYIRPFLNAKEASGITGANQTTITNCCNKRNKVFTSGGYRWSYEKHDKLDSLNKIPKSLKKEYKLMI